MPEAVDVPDDALARRVEVHSLDVGAGGDQLEQVAAGRLPVVQVAHPGGPVLAALPPRLDHGLAREGIPAHGQEVLLGVKLFISAM